MPSNNVCQYSKIQTRKRSAKKSIKTGKKWNPPLFGIRNPLCWNPESSTRDPESTAWNPESKTVLDSLTWGDFWALRIKYTSLLMKCFYAPLLAFLMYAGPVISYKVITTVQNNHALRGNLVILPTE